MTYQEIFPIPRHDAEIILSATEETAICETLVRLAYHDPDWQWVQNQCVRFTADSRLSVRATAVLCLGHLARIHGRLDLDRVNQTLRPLLSEPELKWRVEEVLEDIAMFVVDNPPTLMTLVKKAA